ncbi:MAG TPA: TonB-dependent receptor [Sphingomonas sp.]|nr:TonB-dependent receptor [Sphingomonas sp.]
MTAFRSNRRTQLALRASGIALAGALTVIASPAFAQDTTAAAAPQADDQANANDIVISGFRASLQSATAKKKNLDQVAESVTAEDIGKLPDASIAESIARLPGLTSQRLSGRSNSISIRGFSPDFSTTLLNGREQTTTGDNRAVEYDQYPSEVINSVLVYKTPMASIIGQGLSGTVDLRTIRPLEYGKSVISVGARGSYADLGKLNAKSRDLGYRVNGVYVGQFANDTIGVALSGSYVDEPYQISEFNSWGYASDGTNSVIGGSKSYNTSTDMKRLGLQGTVEWKPTANFTTTFDAFYSDFKDDQIKRGIELPLYWGGAPLSPGATVDPSTGLVTSGTFTNVKGVVRNDAFQRHAKLYSFGWNGAYKGDNGWNAFLDISYSKTDRNELNIESYSGTGRAGVGATDTIGFKSGLDGTTFTHNLNYGDYSLIMLTSPQGWGGTQVAPNGQTIVGGQDGYYNNRIIKDELWQYHTEVEKVIDNGFIHSVQFGLNYTNRGKSLTPDEYFLGLKANTNGTTSVPVPSQDQLGVTNLLFGLGPVVSYDPVALVNAGLYNKVPNVYGDVVVKSYSVREKLMTGYLQTNIKSQWGSSELTGNVGVQVIWTDQNSKGASAVPLTPATLPNGAPNIGPAFRNSSTDYVDVLPSANFSLRLAGDFVIRAAAAREIIRPRLDDMRASASYGYTYATINGVQYAAVTGSSGNPDLRPWRANAFDLTFEKYFGTKGYVAAQFFYKDLKSYVYNLDQTIPTASLALAPPGVGVIVSPTAQLNIPINGKGGKLYGVELAGTLPFGSFVPALDGFGVTGSGSYTITRIHPTPGSAAEDLPGYSKWVVNGTAFFEKWGFNARASVRYRSTFVGEVSGFAANRVRRRAAPETIVDAQIGYDFSGALKGLSIYIQGQNLNNEPFKTYNPGHPEQVIDYQVYGRRFLAGASFKF